MGRLFYVFILLAVLLCPANCMRRDCEQPVFFSMLFPQLIPGWMLEETNEGVQL